MQKYNKAILVQIAVWLGLYMLAITLGTTFGRPEGFYLLIFLRLISMAILFNIVRYWLLGYYFNHKQILFFSWSILSFTVFVTVSVWVEYTLGFTKVIANNIPIEIQQKMTPGFKVLPSVLMGLVVFAAALSLGFSSAFEKKKQDEEAANQRRLEAELLLLKSQINPHFLLNTLNNLYALALSQPDKTPEALLKLSAMVAYILHECDQPKVPLAHDLTFLENYLALQRLRLAPNVTLHASLPQPIPSLDIEPMILITFIENAFKHGLTTRQPCEIVVSIGLVGNQLKLAVVNPFFPHKTTLNGTVSGMGIANTRMRLEYSYPNKHALAIDNDERTYQVELLIEL